MRKHVNNMDYYLNIFLKYGSNLSLLSLFICINKISSVLRITFVNYSEEHASNVQYMLLLTDTTETHHVYNVCVM